MQLATHSEDRINEFRFSIIRFFMSFTVMASINMNLKFGAWQSLPIPSALLFFFGIFLIFILGSLSAFGYRAKWSTPLFCWSILIHYLISHYFFDIKILVHGQVFGPICLILASLGDLRSYYSVLPQKISRFLAQFKNLSDLNIYRFWIGLIYWLAVITKWNEPYLSGVALESHMLRSFFGSLPSTLYFPVWFFQFLSYAGFAIEIALPIMLWLSKTRKWGVILALFFHFLANFLLDIPVFTFAMMVSMIVFIDDEVLRNILEQRFQIRITQ